MAEPVTKRWWDAMAEHQQNRILHFLMSMLTIIVTLGGVFWGYSKNQADTERLIARIEVRLESQSARIASLESARQILDAGLQSDRIIVERRVSSLEAFYAQVTQSLNEIKADIRNIRDRGDRIDRQPAR